MHEGPVASQRDQHKCDMHAYSTLAAWTRRRGNKAGSEPSKAFDQAGIDQEPIEASRFRPAGAGVEKPLAAIEN